MPDRLGQVAVAEQPGEVAVAAGLAVGDLLQQRPDLLLERVADRTQVQVERCALAREVRRQLVADGVEPVVRAPAERLRVGEPLGPGK